MSVGSRVFVALVFFILGVSFLATTGVLIYEFEDSEWFSLAAFYSHLFIFFPSFGLLALAAFYLPASAFTDLYWHHVKFGKARFAAGFVVLAGVSYLVALGLSGGNERSIWEISPDVLTSDRGEPRNCDQAASTCKRLPVLQALANVRSISRGRTGLSAFARDCDPDPLVEQPAILAERRFCFVTSVLPKSTAGKKTLSVRPDQLLTAGECCRAQKKFVDWLSEKHTVPSQRSLTGWVHTVLLPLKVFFLLMLLIVGVLLAIRRRSVDTYYKAKAGKIERGVLVGAFAMLFWPIMNHAFLQSAAVLYGNSGGSTFRYLGPGFSFAFGAWGLLLLFFFYRRYEKSLEAVGKIAGVAASAIAIFKYELIVDYFVRFAGSGATIVTFSVLGFIGAVALVQLFISIRGDSVAFADSLAGADNRTDSAPEPVAPKPSPGTESRYRSDQPNRPGED